MLSQTCVHPSHAMLVGTMQRGQPQPQGQSCGVPERKRSPMKPPERAPPSKAAKQGSVFPVSMRGTRLPSSSCPTHSAQMIDGCMSWARYA